MTFTKCTKTIVMCHCETGNIWSHLIAAIYFVVHLSLLIARAIEIDTGKADIIENNSDKLKIDGDGKVKQNSPNNSTITTGSTNSYNPYSKY